MDLDDLVSADAIMSSLRATCKKQALQEISDRAAAITGLEARNIFDALLQRERLGPTGVGKGVAIPHGKFAGLDRLVGLFARLEEPIAFEAVDDEPVDLIFVLLAPEDAGADHLKALSRVARFLRQHGAVSRLRGCDDSAGMHALLSVAMAESNAA